MESGSGSGVRSGALDGSDEGVTVRIVVVKVTVNCDDAVDGLADKISQRNSISINRHGMGHQFAGHCRSKSFLQADDLLRVNRVGAGDDTISVLVLEEQLTGLGLSDSDVEVGVNIAVHCTSHIEVASLVGVEVFHIGK